MSERILKYRSDPKIYAILCTGTSHRRAFDDLIVSEEFEPNDKYKNISPDHGDYRVIIETEAKDTAELQSKHFIIQNISQELDRAWMYACGHPLCKQLLTFMGPYIDFPDGKINGWSSNFKEVEKNINKGRAHILFSFEQFSHSSYEFWPLDRALTVRESYLKAPESIATMVDLHFFSHKVEDSYSSFFFLAKALELVRALLPGKNDQHKEEHLPDIVRQNLMTSLHHIIGLANSRYEIRHIVEDNKTGSLHKRMNNTEITVYKHDSDLIIRSVVCKELGIPLIIPKRG